MWTPDAMFTSSIAMMTALEASGSRLSKANPYPPDNNGWVPATLHPPGYSILLWGYYELGNTSGMLLLAKITAAVLDAVVCVLLFSFGRNLFSARIGLYSAWIYALLPTAIALNLQLLPDAYARFFAALVLTLASYTRKGRPWAMPAAGFAAGIGFYFRAEFLIWPLILWLCLLFDSRQIRRSTLLSLLASTFTLLAILPWTVWTYHSTGRALLSTSGAGGAMYESLGEISSNPWDIILNDDLLVKHARTIGFKTAWTPSADEHYKRLWIGAILKEPGFYLRTVLTQRLPLALIPPFSHRHAKAEDSNLAKIQQVEHLTKLEVVIRHPLVALKERATQFIFACISFALLLAMLGSIWLERRNMRSMVWLILPWLVTIISMSAIKQIEARNMSTILVVQTVALALVLAAWRDRRNGSRALDSNREAIVDLAKP